MTTELKPNSPLEPINDFGQHHTLVQLLLAVDALGQRVDELGTGARGQHVSRQPPDDFTYALVGLTSLRSNLRELA